jgi:hypothetical protein
MRQAWERLAVVLFFPFFMIDSEVVSNKKFSFIFMKGSVVIESFCAWWNFYKCNGLWGVFPLAIFVKHARVSIN